MFAGQMIPPPLILKVMEKTFDSKFWWIKWNFHLETPRWNVIPERLPRRAVIGNFPIYPIYRFTNFGLNKSADLLINRPIYHRFITDLSPIYYRFITDLPNKSADLSNKSADLSPIYQ